METLKWGFVTAGQQCMDFANAINSYDKRCDPQHELHAVSDLYNSSGRDFLKLYNIPKLYDNYKEMVPHVDVVYIVLNNSDKYKCAKYCLEQGKHVLVVPPLALDLKQVQKLISLSKEKKLLLMEAHHARFSDTYKTLKTAINEDKLGDMMYLRANYGKNLYVTEHPRSMSTGNNLTVYRGTYLLALAQHVFSDDPANVTVTAVGGKNEDDYTWTSVVLEYSDDRRAVLTMSDQLNMANDADIYGTNARATLSKPIRFPTKLTIGTDVKDFPLHSSKQPYYIQNGAGNIFMAIEAGRCIKNGEFESPLITHKDMEARAQFLEIIREQLDIKFIIED
ncbi:trans-1,2-dihydrobenzene-1,2-diol dehydrogenase-like [Pectinophora gossypiella]|uniref:trans-1,2-dihydrobenzene-1,2-diol dehydrogenase-like n=1 Tax=Pectinophora gossypiella TaxID=13191 RepID=UPI00214E371C|nr:trans-1,2-dihydrobenzene-1,2-diol dehydrogenase-like [Pectinophora gossypiella]